MSGISGLSMNYSGASAASLQSQINKLQGEYANCAGCDTTPMGEKQKEQAAIGEQIQGLKMELAKVDLEVSQAKTYQLKNSTQQSIQMDSFDRVGTQLNTIV